MVSLFDLCRSFNRAYRTIDALKLIIFRRWVTGRWLRVYDIQDANNLSPLALSYFLHSVFLQMSYQLIVAGFVVVCLRSVFLRVNTAFSRTFQTKPQPEVAEFFSTVSPFTGMFAAGMNCRDECSPGT